MNLYSDLLTKAQQTAATPYTPYTGQLVAPVNAQQTQGISGINTAAGQAQPYFNTALGIAQQSAQPITAEQIQQYQSPYTQAVVNATQNQFNNQNAQQQQALLGNAIGQGALGGNRVGLAQAALAGQQQLAQAPVIAGLENTGYQQAVNTALAEQQAQQAGAYGIGSLAGAAQNAGLTGANAQLGAGTLEQQTQQAQNAAQYQQYLTQQAYPFQTEQWLAGIGTGVGSQMGGFGSSSTTQPGPSGGSQILGGLTSGLGLLGSTGAFGASGWMTPFFAGLKRGGRAEGGVAAADDLPDPVPETSDTLNAQQQQLVAGHRRAQMFPNGTSELPLPRGMSRTVTKSGAFHYDPSRLSAVDIHKLSGQDRENELLDLGPVSKREVLRRLRGGEVPVAVVERNRDGHEVRAALGTHKTVGRQHTAMLRTKSPGHSLHIEHPNDTIARRMHVHHRARGGGVAGFASGGNANYQLFGGGFGTPTMPYMGSSGFVPTMGITRGPGAEGARGRGAPSATPEQPTDWAGLTKGLSGLAGSIRSGLSDGMPGYGQPGGPVGLDVSSYGDAAVGVPGITSGYRYGGGVAGYADGGDVPNFDERWAGLPDDGPPAPPIKIPDFNDRFTGEAPPPRPVGVAAPTFTDRFDPVMSASIASPTGPTTSDVPLPSERPSDIPVEATPTPVGVAGRLPPERPITGAEAVPAARTVAMATPTAGLMGNIDHYGSVIRNMESSGNYGAVGPQTRTGDHAYGAYGIMGANIPQWTQDVLGRSLTPSEFLNDPRAQDAVFRAKFGTYALKYGPEGAARAWFAGEHGMNNPNARDALGTSVAEYGNRFLAGINGGQPSDTALAAAAPGTTTDLSAQSRQPTGVAPATPNIDWGANSKLWPALIAAGAGMLSSRSPFMGVGIGQGLQAGMAQYGAERQQEMQQSKVDLEAKRLQQQLDLAQRNIQLKEMPYQGAMTTADRMRLAQQQKDYALKLFLANRDKNKPFVSTDQFGNSTTFFPQVGPDGSTMWRPYDPKNRTLGPPIGIPGGMSAPGMSGTAPSAGAPSTVPATGNVTLPPGSNFSSVPPAGGFQSIQFNPAEGAVPYNKRIIDMAQKEGGLNYAQGDSLPYIEKGMDVPEPRPVSNLSVQALKTDAENYIQTGKLPPIARGNSPAALRQQAYQNAVKNYANSVLASRGINSEQAVMGWREAPGMLRYVLGADGRATVSLGTAVRHLDTLADLSKAWGANDMQAVNKVRAFISREFGKDAATNLAAAGKIIGPEIVKAIGVAGAGTEGERSAVEQQFSTAASPEQMLGAIRTTQKLLAGQLEGRRRQAMNAGVSEAKFRSLIGDRPYEELSKLSGEAGGAVPGAAQGALGAAPATPTMPTRRVQNGYIYEQQPDGSYKAVGKAP